MFLTPSAHATAVAAYIQQESDHEAERWSSGQYPSDWQAGVTCVTVAVLALLEVLVEEWIHLICCRWDASVYLLQDPGRYAVQANRAKVGVHKHVGRPIVHLATAQARRDHGRGAIVLGIGSCAFMLAARQNTKHTRSASAPRRQNSAAPPLIQVRGTFFCLRGQSSLDGGNVWTLAPRASQDAAIVCSPHWKVLYKTLHVRKTRCEGPRVGMGTQ